MDALKLCKIGLLKIDRKMQENCIKEVLLPFPLVEPLITSAGRTSLFSVFAVLWKERLFNFKFGVAKSF